MVEYGDGFVVRLRALELSADRVRDACAGTSQDMVLIELGLALGALYDLHEAYCEHHLLQKNMAKQDAHYAQYNGRIVAALTMVRGKRTHKILNFTKPSGFEPVKSAGNPFEGGLVWAPYEQSDGNFMNRNDWYRELVQSRTLWQPLDESWMWFMDRIPDTEKLPRPSM